MSHSSFSWLWPLSWTRYHKVDTLIGHRRAVLALAISPDGKLLASGGYEGMKIWNIHGKYQLHVPAFGNGAVVTSIHWLPNGDVAYGTVFGRLVICRSVDSKSFRIVLTEIVRDGVPIASMDSSLLPNCSRPRLAIASTDGSLSLLAVTSDGLETVFCVELEDTIPASVAFCKIGAPYLIVFARNGEVTKLSCDTGTPISRHATSGSRIGYAALSVVEGKEVYVIDNTFDGFDLFGIDDCAWQVYYLSREPEQNMPNAVVFAESGKLIVGGSNADRVNIYETSTGKRLETLLHSGWGMVQIVAARTIDDRTHMIAVGQSGHRGDIALWVRKERPVWMSKEQAMQYLRWIVAWAVHIFCGVLAGFCIYQNRDKYLPQVEKGAEIILHPLRIIYAWGRQYMHR